MRYSSNNLAREAIMKDHFSSKAHTYEQNDLRVNNVHQIANGIKQSIALNPTMHVMDFGSGTGLLLEQIAPSVKSITAVDVSPSMMAQLIAKKSQIQCELHTFQIDLEKVSVDKQFDGVMSSMTLHHIKDVPKMFKTFYEAIKNGGFVALADLDTEDGSFHTEDTGVHHFGFERGWLHEQLAEAGFKDISISTVNTIQKPQGDYSVFLATAIKR